LDHTVVTTTLDIIVAKVTLENIVATMAFDTILAFVIPLVALLTSTPVI
jgi:hypothetical protein